jgi:DNA-binding HxlR family transcriptional regulator
VTHTTCDRFHGAVELIGARWNGPILRALFNGKQRYCDIRAAVPGISDTMLAHRLRDLEERGLVSRRVSAGPPTRVDYRLTQMGADLQPVLDAIAAWSQQWPPLPVGPSQALPVLHPDSTGPLPQSAPQEVNSHA